MKEEWKDVKGYEGSYKVSNLGRVKSMPRKFRRKCDSVDSLTKGGQLTCELVKPYLAG